MSDSADAGAARKNVWLTPTVIGGAVLLLIVVVIVLLNRCVRNVDLSLPEGRLKIEFCSREEMEQLDILLEAKESYVSKRPDDQRRAAYDADYQERMRTALRYVTGETQVMGPTEAAIERVLAPYLQ